MADAATSFSIERYLALADALPHIVWAADADGAITFLNRRGQEYMGLAADATLGSGWLDTVHPDDATEVAHAWERAIDAGESFEAEYRLRRRDGEYRWHVDTGVPVRGSGGEIEGWLGTLTDIERRVRGEGRVREAERDMAETVALLETLLREAPIGFGFVDTDLRFVRINETLAEINGLPVAEHAGRTVAEVLPGLWPRLRPLYESVLSSGSPRLGVEIVGETPARPGVTRHWSVSYYPVHDEDGALLGVGVVVVEETEQRRLDAQLRARLEQQAAVSELGQVTLRERSPERTMEAAVDALAGALQVEYTKVLRLEPGGEDLALVAGRGWTPGLVGEATVSAGRESQAGFTLIEDEPVVVRDLRNETRFSGPPLLHAHNVVSGISTVIRVRGQLWGVLGIHTAHRRDFNDHDVNFVRSVAHVIAAAIESADADREGHLYSTVLKAMTEGVMVVRVTEPVGTVEYANPRATQMLGYAGNALSGILTGQFSGEEEGTTDERRAEIRAALARDGSWRGELHARTKQGEQRTFAVRVTTLEETTVEPRVAVVIDDVTESRRAEAARRRADELRRRLLAELVHAQETERRRLAADIHDDSLQALSAIKLRLGMLRGDEADAKRRAVMHSLEDDLKATITGLRDLLFELRPPALAEGGLKPALHDLLDDLARDGGPIGRVSGALRSEPSLETRTVIYRIAREALVNVRRHARSARVEVALADDGEAVMVRIRDHGAGFDPEREAGRPGHMGLVSMRERAEMAGGWLHVTSTPGAGTTVEFAIPRDAAEAAG